MQVFGLIGNPVEHSLSPPMHEAAYEALGMDARYVTFEPDQGAGAAAVEAADELGIAGLNVTIPFKREVLAAVEPDPTAARIGAVNTVAFGARGEDGEDADGSEDAGEGEDADGSEDAGEGEDASALHGYNTDAQGAVRALREHDVDLSGRALVVGAGGAGRAVAFALAEEGMTVDVANRTAEKARSLAAEVDDAVDAPATGHGLDALGSGEDQSTEAGLVARADVLVNCTSVGMDEDRSPVPADHLHGDLAVLDAVYSPLETRLLRDAAEAGATTVDGAWMLLYQGVAAFELWTGRDAPVDAMNRALREQL